MGAVSAVVADLPEGGRCGGGLMAYATAPRSRGANGVGMKVMFVAGMAPHASRATAPSNAARLAELKGDRSSRAACRAAPISGGNLGGCTL